MGENDDEVEAENKVYGLGEALYVIGMKEQEGRDNMNLNSNSNHREHAFSLKISKHRMGSQEKKSTGSQMEKRDGA